MKMKSPSGMKDLLATAVALLIPMVVLAAEPGGGDLNRFSASARFLFNVSAEFSHLATPANPGPGVAIHGADHVYDNGYVKLDDSGNAGNQTWNWGFYDQASVAGDTLQLQTVRSPADGSTQTKSDDPQFGFEISYGRVLHQFDMGNGRQLACGILGAFGMTFLDIRNHSTITGATTGVRDSYSLGGLPLIPNAPFYGSAPTPGGPLPVLLPDAPFARDPINLPATATEHMKVEGELYGFKIGPFFEWPLCEAASVQFQGGFAAVLADGKFGYAETISTGGTSAGGASKDDWRYGGFVEGQVSVKLCKGWSTFVGAGWQSVRDYSLTDGTKAVKVNLGNTISAFAGFSCLF